MAHTAFRSLRIRTRCSTACYAECVPLRVYCKAFLSLLAGEIVQAPKDLSIRYVRTVVTAEHGTVRWATIRALAPRKPFATRIFATPPLRVGRSDGAPRRHELHRRCKRGIVR